MDEKEARDFINKITEGKPEEKKLAYDAMYHTKDCRLCKFVMMMLEQIIIMHVEEHKELGK